MDIIVACTIIRLDFISPHVLHTQHDSVCTKSGWEKGANSFLQIETRIPDLACACPLPRRGGESSSLPCGQCGALLNTSSSTQTSIPQWLEETAAHILLLLFRMVFKFYISLFILLSATEQYELSQLSVSVHSFKFFNSIRRADLNWYGVCEKAKYLWKITNYNGHLGNTNKNTKIWVFFVKPWREKN